jgi:hypothetical protein
MNRRRALPMAVGAIVMFFAAMLFGAPSASAITIGNYYCGSNNTPTTGATYHRSGNNPSWYFNLTRCGSFKQTSDSNGKFFSTLMTQTFASFTIGLMNVPDAIQPTVFFERMEYADKYGLLCTATPTSPIAMGQYDKMNFGINATTGDISTAYFVHAGPAGSTSERMRSTTGGIRISSGSSKTVHRTTMCSRDTTSRTS